LSSDPAVLLERQPAGDRQPAGRAALAWLLAAHPRRLFGCLYALFFVMLLAWGIGSPLQQSPDEWAHLYRTAGIYHGQILISAPGAMDPVRGDPVRVPGWLVADREAARCFMHHAAVPVSCSHPQPAGQALVQTATPAARYPPFFYLAVGWPLLFSHGNTALYLMRVVDAAISAAFLALGMSAARRLGASMAATGVIVAVTPMVAWLSTMINPNGLEIAAAVALWPRLLLWVGSKDPRARRAGALGAAAAGSVMVLSRSVAIIWVCVAVVSVLPLVRLSWLRAEFRRRSSLLAVAMVVLAGLISLGWSALSRQTQLAPLRRPASTAIPHSLRHNVGLAYHLLDRWWYQVIGNFGWLDTQVSLRLIHLYELAGLLLLLAALLAAFRVSRLLVLLGAAIAAGLTVAVTLYLSASVANQLSIGFWQGRYSIPMGIGVPVLLGYAARAGAGWYRWLTAGLSLLVGAIVGLVAVKSFVTFFIRNSVGAHRPLDLHGGWQPPGGIVLWLVLLVVSLVGLAILAAAGPLVRDQPSNAGVAE
jgi:hypothetical protein